MSDVLDFGDNFNDISMLEATGLGVAMGNSDDAVKAHADLVIGHNEEPSIAQLIRQRVFPGASWGVIAARLNVTRQKNTLRRY